MAHYPGGFARPGGLLMNIPLLDIPTQAQKFEASISQMLAWAMEAEGRRFVCTATVHTMMLAQEDAKHRAALQAADMVTADGMPLVWLQRRLGYPEAERVYGPDVFFALCQAGLSHGLGHYFWGGDGGVAQTLAGRMAERLPGIKILGADTPPYRSAGAPPDSAEVARLNQSGAQVIWVGLGGAKQDIWMAQHRPLLDAPLLIGVGAAFDFLAGNKRQAPRFLQRAGLEWAFRLAAEPRRLAYRYLVYNPRFVWLAWRRHLLPQLIAPPQTKGQKP